MTEVSALLGSGRLLLVLPQVHASATVFTVGGWFAGLVGILPSA